MLDSIQKQKQSENSAIHGIEKRFLTEERNSTYIALEELDFIWSVEEVITFDELWKAGFSLEYIAEELKRSVDETAMLLIDRKRKGKVEQRKYGIHVQ